MTDLIDAAVSGAPGTDLAGCDLPASYRAAHILKSDAAMFAATEDKDVRKSLHLSEVPMPELAPDEVLIAVMAPAITYNTVWSAIFQPVPTFALLARHGRQGRWAARHDLPHHVLGSDAAGGVVRAGGNVRRWSPGDRGTGSPRSFDSPDPAAHAPRPAPHQPPPRGVETHLASPPALAG